MDESAEIQNSEGHELVIGERVGLDTAAITASHEEPTASHEEPTPVLGQAELKVEPVAHGVMHTGVAQALVEATTVTPAGVEASPAEASPAEGGV